MCTCVTPSGRQYVRPMPDERKLQRQFLKEHASRDLKEFRPRFLLRARRHLQSLHQLEQQRRGAVHRLQRLRRHAHAQPSTTAAPAAADPWDTESASPSPANRSVPEGDAGSASASASAVRNGTGGCRVAEDGRVNCSTAVYRDPRAWRFSHREIHEEIRRLKMQLLAYERIRKHLYETRPAHASYDASFEEEDDEDEDDESEDDDDEDDDEDSEDEDASETDEDSENDTEEDDIPSRLHPTSTNAQKRPQETTTRPTTVLPARRRKPSVPSPLPSPGRNIEEETNDYELTSDRDRMKPADPDIIPPPSSTPSPARLRPGGRRTTAPPAPPSTTANPLGVHRRRKPPSPAPAPEGTKFDEGLFEEYDDEKVNYSAGRPVSPSHSTAAPVGPGRGPGKQGRIDVTVFRPARPSKAPSTPPSTSSPTATPFTTTAPPAPTTPLLPGRVPLLLLTHNQEQHACYCDPLSRREQKELERREKQRIKQERQLRREKKRRRLQQCVYERMNCFSHDNSHWKTAPFWTDGPFCFCMNANNNTYSCLRTINATHNFLYCEFVTGLITFYNLRIDPFEQWNRVHSLSKEELSYLHDTLAQLKACKGTRQCTVGSASPTGSHSSEQPNAQLETSRLASDPLTYGQHHNRPKKKKYATQDHGESARLGKNSGARFSGRGEDVFVNSTKTTSKTITSDNATNSTISELPLHHRFSEAGGRRKGELIRHGHHSRSELSLDST